MDMFAIIYQPTGVPIALFVDKENAISRCKHLTQSRDFIVARVSVQQMETVKIKTDEDDSCAN